VIKLEVAHIEEVRGIRKLDINFGKGTFAISGPNGSGKSGVIDAIEFGLTGQIGRLTGRGTKGLSVAEHYSAAHNGLVAGSSPAGPPADQCLNRFFHFLSISVPHQEHLVTSCSVSALA
jgi:ABC-type hemin transport system ATPase subunit